MSPEAKLRTLAQQDVVLQSFFFTANQIRWFDRQLQPKYINAGSCVRVTRISTIRLYSHETAQRSQQNELAWVRFQIDVLDLDAERARQAANAVTDWLATISLASNAQFSSPVTSPTGYPNQVLGQRAGMEPRTDPPAYVESLDIRVLNLED